MTTGLAGYLLIGLIWAFFFEPRFYDPPDGPRTARESFIHELRTVMSWPADVLDLLLGDDDDQESDRWTFFGGKR